MKVFQPFVLSTLNIALYSTKVEAGFPSPADEDVVIHLNLNQYLISNPASTFFLRVSGDSMIKAGIFDGCLLIVDRSVKVTHNKIVIAAINNEMLIRRLKIKDNKIILISENSFYNPIVFPKEGCIWGVVTAIINKL